MGVTNFYAGSLRYSMNGKKRKKHAANPVKRTRVHESSSTAYIPTTAQRNAHQARIDYDKRYPSFDLKQHTVKMDKEDNSWKIEESKKFTIAPAYNKGAYQVIAKDMVKHIGK